MTKITLIAKANKQEIASGVLGKEVLALEGNYYFPKNLVNLEILKIKPEMYTCPIKRSTCDYYYLKDAAENSREIGWVYETINNTTFEQIQGMVGFYARNSDQIEIKLED